MTTRRKIYVASSWRNTRQPEVVAALRAAGHEVYDFRNPTDEPQRDGARGTGNGFQWSEVHEDWQKWTMQQYIEALSHPASERGFGFDMGALRWCDTCVYVLPCGRSASLEAGWAAGAGKTTVALLADAEPELMIKMVDHISTTLDDVLEFLALDPPRRERSIRDCVLAFHKAVGQPAPEVPAVPADDRVRLRARLITEEYLELMAALLGPEAGDSLDEVQGWANDAINSIPIQSNIVEVADACADLAYVVEGTAIEFGIDSEHVMAEVQRANMAKAGGPRRADGKVMNGPGWTPPDVAGVLRRQGWKG